MTAKSINIAFLTLFIHRFRKSLLCLVLVYSSINVVNAETIRVAVASNFLKTAQQLVNLFEQQNEHKVELSSGSSGKLYLQITKGAPYDVFLSADSDKPNRLVQEGFATTKTKATYALGQLSLWLKSCKHNKANKQNNDWSFLKYDTINKIAIANPKLAPYGYASEQLLLKYQLNSSLKSKLLYPENISQVTQFAKIGVVDAAFVATSHSQQLQTTNSENRNGCLLEISTKDYPTIEQQLVILSNSKKQNTAHVFVNFLFSKKAQDLIKNMGYSLPSSAKIDQSFD